MFCPTLLRSAVFVAQRPAANRDTAERPLVDKMCSINSHSMAKWCFTSLLLKFSFLNASFLCYLQNLLAT